MTLEIAIKHKSFPARENAPGKCLFEDLRLTLPSGEICAVTGPSGIGKSSLLQIVSGLDREFEGSVVGCPRSVGYLFQNPRLLPWRTTRENLELVLGRRYAEATRWLARVGLEGADGTYPQRLSVGMARRVSLARALCVEPKLLLLDEPFAALDEETARQMAQLLREELSRLQPTTLLVTHSASEAESLADRVIVLNGSPARIVEDRSTSKAGSAL